MQSPVERRASRRFTMALPMRMRLGESSLGEQPAETRDVSFRGLYFFSQAQLEIGSSIEFILTLPRQITQVGDVHIRCFGRVVRVEPQETRNGFAARIEKYEFLPAPA